MNGLMVLMILVALVIAVCTGIMAKGQNRSAALWGIFSFVLGALALGILAYLPMLILFFLSRKPGATSTPTATSVFRYTSGAVWGSLVGFGVGYLFRPTFVGETIPLSIIVSPSFADKAFAAQMLSHMLIAVAIGTILGLGGAFAFGKMRLRTA
ncbi:hypothetical protein SAMN05421890_4897 [Ensifer adhaerens]|nr:hypothetical protein SAMN05421890_4897 [Ensifer adhaerens]